MPTNFPSALDALTNPSGGVDYLDTVPHGAQHANANDAIEAIEAKVGVTSSAITTSHDYKIAQLEAKSLANDPLADANGDLFVATANNTIARLPIGTNGFVLAVDTALTPKVKWVSPTAGTGGSRYANFLVAANDAQTAVKDSADYICDGTDDQVEINAALAALPAAGGSVYLSAGTFNISSSILVQQDSTMLIGSGIGGRNAASQIGRGTFLKGATGLTTALILVQNAANNVPVHAVIIRDINVDGNAIGTADGILFKSNQGILENVYVHNCGGDGIQLEAYLGWELYDTIVSHCLSSHNVGTGLFLNTYAADTRVLDCTLYTNTGSGLKIKAGGCQAIGGQYYNNSDYGIVFDGGGSWFMASDIKIENNLKEGIYFNAAATGMEYININGCTFRYNGKGTNNTYSHIGGTGNQQCSNVNISGCRFSGRPLQSPDNKGKYAIDMWNTSGALYWGVLANLFAQPTLNHFGTGAVRNSGSKCKVRGNQGCPDSGLMGTGAITSATTTVVITHDLPYTPTANDIIITPTNNPTNTVGNWWVDTLTSTQFTVNVENAPGASTWTFAWRVG